MKKPFSLSVGALALGLAGCAALPALATQATLVTPGSQLSMTALASFLNSALLSVGSCNSGTSAPANGTGGAAFAGECWINTTANPWVFSYTADGTHWTEFGSLNTSSFVWTPYSNGFSAALGGNLSTAGALTTAGAYGATLTFTNVTNATFPAGSHTLGGLDVSQAWSGTNNFTGTFQIGGYQASLGGAFATAAAFTTAGAYGATLTFTNVTNATFPAGSHTLGGLDVSQAWSGTNNFTGPFQIGGTAQTFPASGALAGISDTQTLTNKTLTSPTINGGSLSGTFSGTYTLGGTPSISGAAVNSGTVAAAYLPTASSSAKGTVQGDGATITINGSGVESCTTATTSQIGCVKPDGTTVTIASGVITASGGSATTVTPGTTTVNGVSANAGYALTNNGGSLVNNQLFSAAGGDLNKFRNGTYDVYQRGTNITIGTSGNYGLDGWKVYFTGSTSVTVNRGLSSGGSVNNSGAVSYMQMVGASGNTDIKVGQRIESYVAAPLASKTVTVQVQFYQTTGSSVTPKISSCYASAPDNFATCTADLAATSLTACASSTWCTESYTFTPSGNAVNGYEVDFDCNAGFTAAQGCVFAAADIRVTPGVAAGINLNPPPPELRPIWTELAFCQRYYTTTYGNGVAPGTATRNGMVGSMTAYNNGTAIAEAYTVQYPVPLRAPASSLLYWDGAGNASKFSLRQSGTWTDNLGSISVGSSGSGSTGFVVDGVATSATTFIHYAASAEL